MHICSCSILFLTKVNTRTIRRVLAVSSAHTIYCFVLDRFDSKSFSLVTVIDRIFIVLYADCIVFDLVSSWASAVAPANPLTFKELEKKEKKLSDAVDHTNRMVLNDTKRLNGPTIHGRLYSSGGQPTDTDTESDSESDRSTHTDARAHRDTQICRPPDRPSGCSRSLQRQSESRSESERDRESERERASVCIYICVCICIWARWLKIDVAGNPNRNGYRKMCCPLRGVGGVALGVAFVVGVAASGRCRHLEKPCICVCMCVCTCLCDCVCVGGVSGAAWNSMHV